MKKLNKLLRMQTSIEVYEFQTKKHYTDEIDLILKGEHEIINLRITGLDEKTIDNIALVQSTRFEDFSNLTTYAINIRDLKSVKLVDKYEVEIETATYLVLYVRNENMAKSIAKLVQSIIDCHSINFPSLIKKSKLLSEFALKYDFISKETKLLLHMPTKTVVVLSDYTIEIKSSSYLIKAKPIDPHSLIKALESLAKPSQSLPLNLLRIDSICLY